jgi:hypothetical protein
VFPADKLSRPSFGSTLGFLLGGAVLFAIGDGVWYSQLPALLQSMYSHGPDAACVNAALRLYTSLGFAVQAAISAGIARTATAQLMGGCLAFFLVSVALLAYTHAREVDVDTGRAPLAGQAKVVADSEAAVGPAAPPTAAAAAASAAPAGEEAPPHEGLEGGIDASSGACAARTRTDERVDVGVMNVR